MHCGSRIDPATCSTARIRIAYELVVSYKSAFAIWLFVLAKISPGLKLPNVCVRAAFHCRAFVGKKIEPNKLAASKAPTETGSDSATF